jgi:signal transduction histidine kinase
VRNLESVSRQALAGSEERFAVLRDQATRRLLLSLGLTILVGLAVARFSLRYAESLEHRTAETYQQVLAAKQNLQQLSVRLLDVQEEERRRLSHELHDEIGQSLTALRIEISAAQTALATAPAVAQERLHSARALAEKTLATVRNISLLLRPSLLDDLGLGSALQWQVEDFSRRTGIAAEFEEQGLHDSIPEAHKICVYRIVQEALNNCLKHSRATRVRVALTCRDNLLNLHVSDNGRGFQPKPNGAAPPCPNRFWVGNNP